MRKIISAIIILSALVISVTAYSNSVMENLSESLIRLHVIAESDSDYDQSIKLAVRDEILKAAGGISADDTELFAKTAEAAANSYLIKNNIPYSAHAEYGVFRFPRKSYKNITLPEGEYNGVRVVLGSGRGHNWWCVMYPPLCVSGDGDVYADKKAEAQLQKALHSGTYDLITTNDETTKIKFRIIELINSLK